MATLILSSVGRVFGGPIGSTIGALIGNQIDRAVIGKGPAREGPRLKELAVTTSSYGTPIARHFGRVRAAGTVLWSTDLVESAEKEGGGKNRPSTTTYSYLISFAVALSSRPISGIGRIWADGNLLRGLAGDLKVGGELRVYRGFGDQGADPLIASAQGDDCPAFRGLAYCVFEALELAEFGNRIPALTFEVIADDGTFELKDILVPTEIGLSISREIGGLLGYTDEGGPISAHLDAIGQLYPMSLDAGGDGLSIADADAMPLSIPILEEGLSEESVNDHADGNGSRSIRAADSAAIPDSLRYYDPARDYMAGLQRADGRARPGRREVVEFPATLDAGTARNMINAAAERAGRARETLTWRIAGIDPAIRPGSYVRVPERSGVWIVEAWEWREEGLDLLLRRHSAISPRQSAAESGSVSDAADYVATPTLFTAVELPWSGAGDPNTAELYAAATSTFRGWTGAALYAVQGDSLAPVGSTGPRRAVTGVSVSELPPADPLFMDRTNHVDIALESSDFVLMDQTAQALANGANRASLGTEIVQFAEAQPLGNGVWRLRGLLRGRGGTESDSLCGQQDGSTFILLDDTLTRIDPSLIGTATRLAAVGLADTAPVEAEIAQRGRSLKPLPPVHPRFEAKASGILSLSWVRRARGGWAWTDEVELPLIEEAERYDVGVGPVNSPVAQFAAETTRLSLSSSIMSGLRQNYLHAPVWVRQVGRFAKSDALFITTIQELQS